MTMEFDWEREQMEAIEADRLEETELLREGVAESKDEEYDRYAIWVRRAETCSLRVRGVSIHTPPTLPLFRWFRDGLTAEEAVERAAG